MAVLFFAPTITYCAAKIIDPIAVKRIEIRYRQWLNPNARLIGPLNLRKYQDSFLKRLSERLANLLVLGGLFAMLYFIWTH